MAQPRKKRDRELESGGGKSGSAGREEKVYHLTRERWSADSGGRECHGSRPTRVGNYSAAQLRFQTELLIV